MRTCAVAIQDIEQADHYSSATPRERLERAARLLPDSDLKSVILATLADREPTLREALTWTAALQAHRLARD
jgi:hypothetical protein